MNVNWSHSKAEHKITSQRMRYYKVSHFVAERDKGPICPSILFSFFNFSLKRNFSCSFQGLIHMMTYGFSIDLQTHGNFRLKWNFFHTQLSNKIKYFVKSFIYR